MEKLLLAISHTRWSWSTRMSVRILNHNHLCDARNHAHPHNPVTSIPVSLKKLVRRIARLFCAREHIPIVDALVYHGLMRSVDLRDILQYSERMVTSAIGALEQDRFVKPVMLKQPVLAKRARLDQGLTSQQGSVVDITVAQYYYVDWCEVTNIARLRIHKLQSRHEVRSCNIDPVGKYICTTPSCQAVYSPFQFAELYNSVQNNLVCPKCKCILVSSRTAAASSAHAYTMQMNAALGDVLACFAEVDGAVIAESAVVPIAPATSYWATVREEGREVARGNYAANRYYTVGGGEGAHAMAAHVATKEVAKIYPEWYATREGGKRGAHDMRRDSEESWASSIGEEGVCTDEGEDNFLDHRQSDPLEETGSTDHDVAALRMQEQTIMISGKLKRVCDLRQQDFEAMTDKEMDMFEALHRNLESLM